MTISFFKRVYLKTRHITLYGLLMAVLVFLLKWFQWRFLIIDNSMDIYIGLIAMSFTALGIWVALQMVNPQTETIVVEREICHAPAKDAVINEAELKKLNLSNREYDVLQLLTKGYSNAAIAERLFLSVSTVKTHVSGLFIKMEVKSRTQVIEKAQRLKITL